MATPTLSLVPAAAPSGQAKAPPAAPPVLQGVQPPAQAAPFDVELFLKDHRLHVEGGSHIDGLVLVHPRELHPKHDKALYDKIQALYTVDPPSFFADDLRRAVAESLVEYAPLSPESKETEVAASVTKLLKEYRTGEDADLAKLAKRTEKPFAALVEGRLDARDLTPAQKELLGNAAALYLMLDEALRRSGHREPMAKYLAGARSPEGIVTKLLEKLGVPFEAYRETARKEGVDGVGKLLGLDEAFLHELDILTHHYLPKSKFSWNTVANWHAGRGRPGMQSASLQDMIEAGAALRARGLIAMLRPQAEAAGFDVPEDIRQAERKLVGGLRYLPPNIAETLFLIGTEFAYTPAGSLKPLMGGAQDAPYGFHRTWLPQVDGIEQGIHQIFVSAKQSAEEFSRVLIHEAHHLLFPAQLGKAEIERVDRLAASDGARLKELKGVMDAWMGAKTDRERMEALQKLNQQKFAVNGKNFSEAAFGADLLTFHNHVQEAYDRLQIDSERYHNSGGYATPEARFAEINSRYAELRHVRLRENPAMLQFIVPGLTETYDQVFMPHIDKQLQSLRERLTVKAARRQEEGGAAVRHGVNCECCAKTQPFLPAAADASPPAVAEAPVPSVPAPAIAAQAPDAGAAIAWESAHTSSSQGDDALAPHTQIGAETAQLLATLRPGGCEPGAACVF